MITEFTDYAPIFKALSDPTRLEIMRILDKGPRTVNEIVDFFHLSQPTISRHLATLAKADLTRFKKTEQQKYYTINIKMLEKLKTDFFDHFSSVK